MVAQMLPYHLIEFLSQQRGLFSQAQPAKLAADVGVLARRHENVSWVCACVCVCVQFLGVFFELERGAVEPRAACKACSGCGCGCGCWPAHAAARK